MASARPVVSAEFTLERYSLQFDALVETQDSVAIHRSESGEYYMDDMAIIVYASDGGGCWEGPPSCWRRSPELHFGGSTQPIVASGTEMHPRKR